MERYKTVIVGAGVIGASAAFRLAKQGEEVAIVDRKEPGLEASGVNAGTLAVQNKYLSLIPLAMRGVEMWQEFEAITGRDLHYRRPGGLRVAHTTKGARHLTEDAKAQRALGLEVVHMNGDEARQIAPYLSSSVMAANWCSMDGHNNSLTATYQLVQAAVAEGAVMRSRTEVTGLGVDRAGWKVKTSSEAIAAERVIVAAGLWTRELLKPFGLNIPLQIRNNQMMVTEAIEFFLDHVITHVSGRLTLKQKDVGTVLIGGGWPGHHDLKRNIKWPSLSSMVGNSTLAIRTVPQLAKLRVIRSWAGLDGTPPRGEPIMGPVDGLKNLYFVTSCRGAYTIGPVLGWGIAVWALNGSPPEILRSFVPKAI